MSLDLLSLRRTSVSREQRRVRFVATCLMFCGLTTFCWSQQYTSPTHTAILISLEPVFAAITSWLVAREHLGPRILLGAALIFAGILLAELKGATPIAPESPEPEIRPQAD